MSARDPQAVAGPFRETITEGQVARFCESTGFSPELRARIGVPPTFITRYRTGEFELFEKLGVPLSSVLHAEQGYDYRAPIEVGDQIEYTTQVANIVEKNAGGRHMKFLTLVSEFSCRRGERNIGVVAVAKTVVVVRGSIPHAA